MNPDLSVEMIVLRVPKPVELIGLLSKILRCEFRRVIHSRDEYSCLTLNGAIIKVAPPLRGHVLPTYFELNISTSGRDKVIDRLDGNHVSHETINQIVYFSLWNDNQTEIRVGLLPDRQLPLE